MSQRPVGTTVQGSAENWPWHNAGAAICCADVPRNDRLAACLQPTSFPPHREKQAALVAEEERRKAAQRAAAAKFRADIGGQLGEKEAAKLAALKAKREELVALMADLEVRQGPGARVGPAGGRIESHRAGVWQSGAQSSCSSFRSLPGGSSACTPLPRTAPSSMLPCNCFRPKPRHAMRTTHAPAGAPPAPIPPLQQVCKKTGVEAKAAELAKMHTFKAELDAQIEDNQVCLGWGFRVGAHAREGSDV